MTSLRLYSGRDSDEMIRRLRKALESNLKVSTLEVKETVLEEDVIEAIVNILFTKQVETVELDDCGAYINKQAIQMARALGNVKNLRLSEHTFLSQYFLDILLVEATNLANLRIQDYLSAGQVKALSEGLKLNQSLESLDLSRSRLDGISSLAPGLRENKCLHLLRLRSLNLKDDNSVEVLDALQTHPTLKVLDMSFNNFRHLDNVTRLVSENRNLRDISIGYQNVWQAPKVNLTQFLRALQSNTSLISLSLARSKMNDGDAENLAVMLRRNVTLQNLDVRENRLSDQGMRSLAEAIASQNTLRKLNVASNPFAAEGIECLLAMVRDNVNLVHIELTDSSSTAKQVRYYATLNKCGRRLIYEDPSLGVWSLALEKINTMDLGEEYCSALDANEESQKLDALYFFLQGPALFEGLVCR
jgi:Ran GTPase-activating protein (RanGAP) involved in mRNA processing and transport